MTEGRLVAEDVLYVRKIAAEQMCGATVEDLTMDSSEEKAADAVEMQQ